LIEVALVISVIGVAAAMFLPAFLGRIETSKYTEVRRELSRITESLTAYYEQTHDVHGQQRSRCLPASVGPTPPLETQGAVALNFGDEAEGGHATWAAIGYQPTREVRFRYSILVSRSRCGVSVAPRERLAEVVAEGDLDGDGAHSRFSVPLFQEENGGIGLGPHLIDRDRAE